MLISIALAYVTSRRRQTAVSVLGVMMGVGFFIGIAAMMQGFQQDFIQRIIDVSPHITIKDEFRTPPIQPIDLIFNENLVELRGIRPKNEPRGIRSARFIIQTLEKRDGVAIAPTLTGQAILRFGGKDTSITLIGIEPEKEKQVSNLDADLTEGNILDLRINANGIIIGVGIAETAGVAIGDNVSVVSAAGITLQMSIVGIFDSGIIALDNNHAYVLLKKNQILQKREDTINQIRIRLDDIDKAENIARQIENQFSYRTESWREANSNIFGIFTIQNGIIYSTVSAILIVAGFGIFNVISTVVNEKRRDIAILKSIGFSEGEIQRIFLVQGFVIGILGIVLGWLLGWVLIELLDSIKFDIEGMVRSEGFILNRSIWNFLFAGTMALFAATLSAYLPARNAAALNPVDIIRGAV